MSKAEKFISDCTRNCSNEILEREYDEIGCKVIKGYKPWLTPDEARRAVEIAREEVRQQMMKDAVDGLVTFEYYGNDNKTYGCIAHDPICLDDVGVKDTDKVKIILIKED